MGLYQKFEYVDPDSDTLELTPFKANPNGMEAGPGTSRVLALSVIQLGDQSIVHLSQDAVNALAQYLDAHRTDTAGHTGMLPESPYPDRYRCDRARVGIGRCEFDTGHPGTHRYCGSEWDNVAPVSDACPARYSNTGRDDDDQPCEKPAGHPRPHRAESEKTSYVWTDYNPRAYMAETDPSTGADERDALQPCSNAGSCALCDETSEGS